MGSGGDTPTALGELCGNCPSGFCGVTPVENITLSDKTGVTMAYDVLFGFSKWFISNRNNAPGCQGVFYIKLTNTGSVALTNITITDTWPLLTPKLQLLSVHWWGTKLTSTLAL